MEKRLFCSHSVFPTPDINRTSNYYEKVMGFTPVKYLDATEPHICLYRDDTEIILTKANIVHPLFHTDYHNTEFVVEDIDGRWIGFGIKDKY
jgi:catechol 2,3-dioxygenase-like lactoylglutathione lyase family enzyme